MSADTLIEWAHDTTSPWWGCTKYSEGCKNCYAESLARRFKRGTWGPNGTRALQVEACLEDLRAFARKAQRTGQIRRVFLGSMCDVMEQHPALEEPRKRLWAGLHALSCDPLGAWIRVLVLTKRTKELAEYAFWNGWPSCCWAGTSVENQAAANERIPHLVQVPAAVHFLSCEPLLGPVNLRFPYNNAGGIHNFDALRGYGGFGNFDRQKYRIHWVIAGGESGPAARPMHPDWALSLRDQCVAASVPFLFKQWGEFAPGEEIEASGTDHTGMYEDDPIDGGVPKHYFRDAPIRETARRFGKGEIPHNVGGDTVVLRVGKKAAGRLLDGRTWDEVPHV